MLQYLTCSPSAKVTEAGQRIAANIAKLPDRLVEAALDKRD